MTDIPSSDQERAKRRAKPTGASSEIRTDPSERPRMKSTTSKIYVDGEFVDGSDVLQELYDREELDERLRIS